MNLKTTWEKAVAWEKANSRKIAVVLGGIVVKSAYAKTGLAVLLALLGMQG